MVVACFRVGGMDCGSTCMGSFEGGHHYLHYLHHSLAQVNSREGTQLHPSTEHWIEDLLSMALPIRTRPSIPLSQSIPSGSVHEPLIILRPVCPTLCNPWTVACQAPLSMPARLLCPWNFPGKNTGVGCHFLLAGFWTEPWSPALQAYSLLSEPPGKRVGVHQRADRLKTTITEN